MNATTRAQNVNPSNPSPRKQWEPPTIEESSVAALTESKLTAINNECFSSKSGS